MLSVNKRVAPERPEPSRLEPSLLTVPRPHPSPENPLCRRCNALYNHHTSHRSFSPLMMRRPPQQQQTWTYSLARPTSRTTPFCRRIGHRRQPARIMQGATRRLNLRCCSTARPAGGAGCAASANGKPAAVERGARSWSAPADQGVLHAAEEVRVCRYRAASLLRLRFWSMGDGHWRRDKPVTSSGY
ncbi:hypothetical protein EDB85DRAFT_1245722 [Lactarius pseudohatsudake]|nr:hypothetical protein EDB85DRAFT_1245722 [Lactarius pseudohatsudake]